MPINEQFEFLPFTTSKLKLVNWFFSYKTNYKLHTNFSRYFISIKFLTIKISYGNIKLNLKIGVPKKLDAYHPFSSAVPVEVSKIQWDWGAKTNSFEGKRPLWFSWPWIV